MKTFQTFVRHHRSQVANAIKDIPSSENWGEVRMHLRREGLSDDELVKARTLWREYKDADVGR